MKKIIVLISTILLVGCSADYTLIIDSDGYHESINIQSANDSEKELMFSNDWVIPINYIVYSEMNDSDYETSDNMKHYKYTSSDNAINFTYDFDYNTIQKSTALRKCYESSRVVKSNNQIIITTSNENTCLKYDADIEKMTINIIVNTDDVTYSNEDERNGNKYTWYINRNNYQNKSINITINDENSSDLPISSSLNRSSNNRLNTFNINIDKNFIIFGIIFFIVVGSVILIYQKIQKDDK